ncbi:MAG: radical SAM protein, partial [Candidatus Omnitrophica bacterium]|nr:radical SAM protein [Candidatus Omnitrophota bacterium]
RIIKSCFSAIIVAYLFETVTFVSFLPNILQDSVVGSLTVWLLIPVRIYLYSGIFGSLVEVVSGQERVGTFSGFKSNAKKFWKEYFYLTLLLYFIHFLLFVFFQERKLSIHMVHAHFDMVISLIFAGVVISKKYLRPLSLEQRPVGVNIKEGRILAILYVANVFLFYVPDIFEITRYEVLGVLLFLAKALQLFVFIYVTSLILGVYPEIKKKFTFEKELLLVNPLSGRILQGIGSYFIFAYPPVFVVLKALTPKNYNVREFNRVFWQDRYYQSNKLVAITCYTSNSPEAYKIAKEFKKRGSVVIMGGPHVTHVPDEALEYCDSVVVGEAEGVWKNVVEDYEKGELKKKYMGQATREDYQAVHQQLMQSPPEVVREFLETTRGCKYKCYFCAIPALYGGHVRKKPIHETVELIKKVKEKYRNIKFIDNNIYADPAYSKELFEALKPLKVHWATQCTIDIANNKEMLKLAKESGCGGFLVGYEIAGGSLEKQQGGKLAMAEKYVQFTRTIQQSGISIKGHFIYGFDSDNFKSLLNLWKFCFKVRPGCTALSLLTPVPGTRFYDDMLAQGRILNLNWRNYTFDAPVFKFKQINHTAMAFGFPAIRLFFLFTTSFGWFLGFCLLMTYAFFS